MENNSQVESKVTSLDYLVEISKGNTRFVKEMIKAFCEENPNEIELLETGLKEKDLEKINVAAHKLRSTAPFVGIDRHIQSDITEIERLAESEKTKKIEINPDENPDIQKIEIVIADTEILLKIEQIFERVKAVCEKAREELMAQK
jgi:HPt (histidine-containing phosphotransfer) domain-containing protein